MLVRMAISMESKMVKTEMIEKIPIVIPSKERIVRLYSQQLPGMQTGNFPGSIEGKSSYEQVFQIITVKLI